MTSNDGGFYPPPGQQPWGGQQGPPPGFPGYQQPPQQPAPGPKSWWPWIIGGGAALLVVTIVAAVAFIAFGSGGEENKYDSHRTVVTYEVTGAPDSVEVIYQSATGREHVQAADLPWGKTVTLEGEDAFFNVSARTIDGSDQELACRVITLGSTLLEDRTVGGSVTCDGRLNEK